MSSRSDGVTSKMWRVRPWVSLIYVVAIGSNLYLLLTGSPGWVAVFRVTMVVGLSLAWWLSDLMTRQHHYLGIIKAELTPLVWNPSAVWLALHRDAPVGRLRDMARWLRSVDVVQVPPADRHPDVQRIVAAYAVYGG